MNLSGKFTLFDNRSAPGWWLSMGIMFLCFSPAANSDSIFKPFSASFSVYRSAIPLGKLELEFSLPAKGRYFYHAHTRPGLLAGLFSGDEIVEESHGSLNPQGVTPERYHYQQDDGDEENTLVHFDWSENKVNTTSEGVTWSQPIEAGTQDRLSQQLMVRLHLAQGSDDLEYEVADGGKIKHYRFQVVSRETVKTPYGKLNCLRVERSKESRPPDYTIWFATELDYLPVRIERKQSSGHYRMVLDELKGFEF
ncbi:MAG: DUF3108 domain-containing protein [Candidatus Thiodiazotropha sp. (ex Semelilucina semeliformis)]|nr:DUF3108 domain-containing protein [Candidatus Thiodiazotropha sp. (ex Semelilucina semeliformis)]